jgi:hypothetical protein
MIYFFLVYLSWPQSLAVPCHGCLGLWTHAEKKNINRFSRPFNILDLGRPRDFKQFKLNDELLNL